VDLLQVAVAEGVDTASFRKVMPPRRSTGSRSTGFNSASAGLSARVGGDAPNAAPAPATAKDRKRQRTVLVIWNGGMVVVGELETHVFGANTETGVRTMVEEILFCVCDPTLVPALWCGCV
jgi:hypothetical protein